ncbi:MAG TPA: FecR domain-containing protein [Flavisolibacter sp.]|jgi:transmembrane sensor|nr:FecR domain-containing protein [Flavisolibacter sp.]
MSDSRLKYLLDSYITKTISPEEEQELFYLIASGNFDEQIKEYMSDAWHMEYSELMNKQQSKKILDAVFSHERAKVVSIQQPSKRKLIWVAASILLVAASVTIFLIVGNHATTSTLSKNQNKQITNDVMPGTSGAILKLDDGSSVVLDNASNGNLLQQGNTLVVKNGASISYVNGNVPDERQVRYNTVETPKGRQFQLVLEDGTKVWLNAASSIRFPVAFVGKQRVVEITGEAYFEVAKNKQKPFQVMYNGSIIEVLGTHFNVNAYADEETMNTTLLEGSVKIVKGSNQRMIEPGEQAQVHKDGSVHTTSNVNVDEVVAWKNNTFLFDNTDVRKLMRQLSRWYNVDVVFKGATGEPLTLYGTISRTATLSTVLKMLESTGDVKLSIEGNKIIVSM